MRSIIDGFEQGENIYCPYCAKEGKKQMFVCWPHGYVYQKWWKGYRKAFLTEYPTYIARYGKKLELH